MKDTLCMAQDLYDKKFKQTGSESARINPLYGFTQGFRICRSFHIKAEQIAQGRIDSHHLVF